MLPDRPGLPPDPGRQQARSSGAHHAAVGEAVGTHRDALKQLFPVPPSREPRGKRAVTAGAAALLAVAAMLWWWDPAYRSERYSTRVGERVQVELPDGSRLVLDTGSAVEVQWHLRTRRATLASGRAQFIVASATWRPFLVTAGPAQVRVVGTRFDVWREAPDTSSVSVYEGRVAVWREGQAPERGVSLQAGQQARLPAQGAPAVQVLENRLQDAWKEGRLVFQDTPLVEAVAAIQRYRGTPIRIVDSRIGALRVSGVFDSSNTDRLLALLPGILPVKVLSLPGGGVALRSR